MSGGRGNWRKRNAIRRALRLVEDSCWLCGLPLDDNAPAKTPWATEIDEDIPVSKGGDPLGSNTELHLVHRCCNIHKSNGRPKQGELREWALQKRRSERRNTIIFNSPFD